MWDEVKIWFMNTTQIDLMTKGTPYDFGPIIMSCELSICYHVSYTVIG